MFYKSREVGPRTPLGDVPLPRLRLVVRNERDRLGTAKNYSLFLPSTFIMSSKGFVKGSRYSFVCRHAATFGIRCCVRHQCLFCDSRANSREDVMPVWIQRKRQGARAISLDGFSGQRPIIKQGLKRTFKISCVCVGCNSGWMSRLETETKPILAPLMDDLSLPLNGRHQFTLAKWAMKTSMTGETLGNRKERTQFYTREQAIEFKNSWKFPGHTLVSMGRYTGKYELGFFCVEAWDKLPTDPTAIKAYITTILTGKVVFQVISIQVPGDHSNRPINLRTRRGNWDKLLVNLDPFSCYTLTWPPLLSFSDLGSFSLLSLIERCSLGVPLSPVREFV